MLLVRRVATERSNAQILTNLSWLDIALVALMTGFSEELLFRGAIIPGSFLDWCGSCCSVLSACPESGRFTMRLVPLLPARTHRAGEACCSPA